MLRIATHFLSAIVFFAACALGDEIFFRVSGDPAACHEVRLPSWQSRKPTTNGCRYDFRSPGGSELYIGVYCLDIGGRWESPVKYGIEPARPKQVTRVDQRAWDAGTDLKVELYKAARTALLPNGIELGGHLLLKSGPKWRNKIISTLISPGQSRVALNSWDGVAGGPGPFEPGRIRADGKYWVDIYDVPSGGVCSLFRVNFTEVSTRFQATFKTARCGSRIVTSRFLSSPGACAAYSYAMLTPP